MHQAMVIFKLTAVLSLLLLSTTARAATTCITPLPDVTLTAGQTYIIAAGECPGVITWPTTAINTAVIFEPGSAYFHSGGSIDIPSSGTNHGPTSVSISGVSWEIPVGASGLFTRHTSGSGHTLKQHTFQIRNSHIVSHIWDPLAYGFILLNTGSIWSMKWTNIIVEDHLLSTYRTWAVGWRTLTSSTVSIDNCAISFSTTSSSGTVRYLIYHNFQILHTSVTIRNTRASFDPASTRTLAFSDCNVSPFGSNINYLWDNVTVYVRGLGIYMDNGQTGSSNFFTIRNSHIETDSIPVALGGTNTNSQTSVHIENTLIKTPSANAVVFQGNVRNSQLRIWSSRLESTASAVNLKISTALDDSQDIGDVYFKDVIFSAPEMIYMTYPYSSISGSLSSSCSFHESDLAAVDLKYYIGSLPSIDTGAMRLVTNNSACPYSNPATPAPPPPPTVPSCTAYLADVVLDVPGTTYVIASGECPGRITVRASQITIHFLPGAKYFHSVTSSIVITEVPITTDLTVIIQGVEWLGLVNQYRLFTYADYGTMNGFKLLVEDSTIDSLQPDPIGLYGWRLWASSNVTFNRVNLKVSDDGNSGDLCYGFKVKDLRDQTVLHFIDSQITVVPTGKLTHSYAVSIGGFIQQNCDILFKNVEVFMEHPPDNNRDCIFMYWWSLSDTTFVVENSTIVMNAYRVYGMHHSKVGSDPSIAFRNSNLDLRARGYAYGFQITNEASRNAIYEISSTTITTVSELDSRAVRLRMPKGYDNFLTIYDSTLISRSNRSSFNSGWGPYTVSLWSNGEGTTTTIRNSRIEAHSLLTPAHAFYVENLWDTDCTMTISDCTVTATTPDTVVNTNKIISFASQTLGNGFTISNSVFVDDGSSPEFILDDAVHASVTGSITTQCVLRNPVPGPKFPQLLDLNTFVPTPWSSPSLVVSSQNDQCATKSETLEITESRIKTITVSPANTRSSTPSASLALTPSRQAMTAATDHQLAFTKTLQVPPTLPSFASSLSPTSSSSDASVPHEDTSAQMNTGSGATVTTTSSPTAPPNPCLTISATQSSRWTAVILLKRNRTCLSEQQQGSAHQNDPSSSYRIALNVSLESPVYLGLEVSFSPPSPPSLFNGGRQQQAQTTGIGKNSESKMLCTSSGLAATDCEVIFVPPLEGAESASSSSSMSSGSDIVGGLGEGVELLPPLYASATNVKPYYDGTPILRFIVHQYPVLHHHGSPDSGGILLLEEELPLRPNWDESGSSSSGEIEQERLQPASARVGQSGIFGQAEGPMRCTTSFFFTAIVAFLYFVAIYAWSLYSEKKYKTTFEQKENAEEDTEDANRRLSQLLAAPNTWLGIPLWRSLLLSHTWVAGFVPCHHQCALAHAFSLILHVFALQLAVAFLTPLMPGVSTLGCATVAVLLTSGLRPAAANIFYFKYSSPKQDSLDRHHRDEDHHGGESPTSSRSTGYHRFLGGGGEGDSSQPTSPTNKTKSAAVASSPPLSKQAASEILGGKSVLPQPTGLAGLDDVELVTDFNITGGTTTMGTTTVTQIELDGVDEVSSLSDAADDIWGVAATPTAPSNGAKRDEEDDHDDFDTTPLGLIGKTTNGSSEEEELSLHQSLADLQIEDDVVLDAQDHLQTRHATRYGLTSTAAVTTNSSDYDEPDAVRNRKKREFLNRTFEILKQHGFDAGSAAIAAGGPLSLEWGRIAPTMDKIQVDGFRKKGHILMLFLLSLIVVITFIVLATEVQTESKCSATERSYLLAVILDFFFVQPFVVLSTLLFRYMLAENDDDDDLGDDGEGCVGDEQQHQSGVNSRYYSDDSLRDGCDEGDAHLKEERKEEKEGEEENNNKEGDYFAGLWSELHPFHSSQRPVF